MRSTLPARGVVLVLTFIVLAGCVPSSVPSPTPAAGQPPRQTPTLSIVLRAEPSGAQQSSSGLSDVVVAMFSAALASTDSREVDYPVLATTLPQLNTDSWRVFPDGRMETVYRLRPDLTWHDGAPLTAEDFVFGQRVRAARIEWGHLTGNQESRLIGEAQAVDPATLLIRWTAPYAEAAAPELFPMPRHILEPILELRHPETLAAHPYWSGEFVGAGPFKLTQWESGAFIDAAAFDGFALGRPALDRIRVTWSSDPNATLARLLAGDAHFALDDALQFQQIAPLRHDWLPSGQGALVLSPTRLRLIQIQHRADYVSPRALNDPRVRRALYLAIDRKELAETMLEGEGMVADAMVPPTVGYWTAVERAVTKYPYFDPRQSEQLMSEVGFAKGADGIYARPGDGRFSLEFRGVAEGQEAQDSTIMADYLRRAGFDASLNLLTRAQRVASEELQTLYPALSTNNNTLRADMGMTKLATSQMATPENQWLGSNKTGYSNPRFDAHYAAWNVSLDRGERDQHMVEMARIVSLDLPTLPLYLNFEVIAHVANLHGPLVRAPRTVKHTNVNEWRWK